MRTTDGRVLLHRLLDISDVFIVNTRASTLGRWQLNFESLRERHPELVMLHVTGYGYGGPATDRPGFGTLAEAMSGFAHVTGQPDGPPTLPPFMLADGVAGLAATYAVMMALYHRDVHGAQANSSMSASSSRSPGWSSRPLSPMTSSVWSRHAAAIAWTQAHRATLSHL